MAFAWYNADVKEVYGNGNEYSDIVDTHEEVRWGAVLGMNTLFPVCKGWGVNTNIGYFKFPGDG